jgi:phenylalanyl-tRNA synthetase beta chain
MRTSLVPNVLATVRDNINRGAHDLKLFEVGPIYRQSNEGSLPAQETHLVVAMTGRREPSHWSNGEAPAVDVYDVKGVAEMLLEGFRLSATFETRNAGQTFDPDVCAEIARNGEPIGVMGRVSAAVCNSLDIERDIYMLSMNLHDILEAPSSPVQFTPVAPYPPSLRDLAVVVAADVPGGEVLRLATEAGGKYLKRVQLFDVYEGDQVAPGKKSMAISLVFQSAEQTLSDKVTQKASDAILRKLREQVGAELR